MAFVRNLLNSGGDGSYFTFIFFLLLFIIFVFGSIALLDYMFTKLFNKQED